ncbi:hypothetical protein NKH99_14640 [Mesorhizobium sp. M0854]
MEMIDSLPVNGAVGTSAFGTRAIRLLISEIEIIPKTKAKRSATMNITIQALAVNVNSSEPNAVQELNAPLSNWEIFGLGAIAIILFANGGILPTRSNGQYPIPPLQVAFPVSLWTKT